MASPEGAFLYIVRGRDGSLYTGTTRTTLEIRLAEHNAGTYGGYTTARRPVTLAYSDWFDSITDAIAAERQLKGLRRGKKEALIRGDFEALKILARRRGPDPSRRPPPAGSPG